MIKQIGNIKTKGLRNSNEHVEYDYAKDQNRRETQQRDIVNIRGNKENIGSLNCEAKK